MTDAIPYRFDVTRTAASLHEEFDALETGAETGTVVTVAGRVLLRRVQGKITFAQLQDSSGRVQLFAGKAFTDRYDELTALNLGDWIGVTGDVVKTRTGELSVKVQTWTLLAQARRPFPDKWHGLSDVDTRYRQRYVDLVVTEESRRTFLLRSRVVSYIRRELEARGFLEVETPILHSIPGGATARPFVTHHNSLDMELYLRIAIELHLKRLIVGGLERVYEIGRVFRNEGLSPRNLPEFTMLELYQAYADYHDMMSLTEELVSGAARELCGTAKLTYGGRELDLTPPWRRASLAELVEEQIGEHVGLDLSLDDLRAVADRHAVPVDLAWGSGKVLLEIYEKTTETKLWGPVFVCDYPKEVSPLARQHRDDERLVERFEPVVAGRELGNAYSELVDPVEQRLRFEEQAKSRAAGDDEAMLIDEDFVRALEYGLPPTGGLGIGIDRLVMLLAGVDTIRDVVLFPTLRPEQGSS